MSEEKEVIKIKSKKEYKKVQEELLSKGYKWIDGSAEYFDLYEPAKHFYRIVFVIDHNKKIFEWNY